MPGDSPVGLRLPLDSLSWKPFPPVPERSPFEGASYRYESLSRFTATMPVEAGGSLVVVLSRQGLRWRLTDVRLP